MPVLAIPLSALPAAPEQARSWCAQLEAGVLLYFPRTPVPIPAADLDFLLSHQQTGSRLHKNIAYKPGPDLLSGLNRSASRDGVDRLHDIMRRYSASVAAFLADFLAPYGRRWQLDYASYRPIEEAGRDLPMHSRNDLLHTDAFPTRPTHGARILRFFHNIHPTRTRDWVVSEPFPRMVGRFVRSSTTSPVLKGHGFLSPAKRADSSSNGTEGGLQAAENLIGEADLKGRDIALSPSKGADSRSNGTEGASQAAENLIGEADLKGHDFSRAEKPNKSRWALAPEGCFAALRAHPTPHPLALPHPETPATRAFRQVARATGLAALIPSLKRSPYDEFMMRLHNTMKEDAAFQRTCPREAVHFAPGSSWMVYTETVPHAVLAGQYALEQTFLVDPAAMVTPDSAPVAFLEKMACARIA